MMIRLNYRYAVVVTKRGQLKNQKTARTFLSAKSMISVGLRMREHALQSGAQVAADNHITAHHLMKRDSM
jgi:hypothetical protein